MIFAPEPKGTNPKGTKENSLNHLYHMSRIGPRFQEVGVAKCSYFVGLGFRVQGLGVRVWFRVQGLGLRITEQRGIKLRFQA